MTPEETEMQLGSGLLEPGEHHFQIAVTAESWLRTLVKGNGLEPTQLRLVKHDTAVHALTGNAVAVLKPHYVVSQKKGKVAAGEECGSREEVMALMESHAASLMPTEPVQAEIIKALQADPGLGWEMPYMKIGLESTRKDYCHAEQCLKCAGQGMYKCVPCHATGKTHCVNCTGHGEQQCKYCFGTGTYTRGSGEKVPCQQCGADGLILCTFCQGHKIVMCKTCNGKMEMPCMECAGSGWWTHVYSTIYNAEIDFTLERELCDLGALEMADALGQRVMAVEQHAEVLRDLPEPRGAKMIYPLIALLPISEAEFSVSGKKQPALVVGLKGRVMQMASFLDAFVKPGLTALKKVGQGGAVSSLLLETACKTRLASDTLHFLPGHTKKKTFEKISKEYAPVLSEKYMKAAVKYAAAVLFMLGRVPRLKGLAVGTLAALVIAAGWFITPLRETAVRALLAQDWAQHILLGDIFAWIFGWGAAVLAIKLWATHEVKRILPGGEKDGLQPAGDEGLYALGTTFLCWLVAAFFAAVRPEWLVGILRVVGV